MNVLGFNYLSAALKSALVASLTFLYHLCFLLLASFAMKKRVNTIAFIPSKIITVAYRGARALNKGDFAIDD